MNHHDIDGLALDLAALFMGTAPFHPVDIMKTAEALARAITAGQVLVEAGPMPDLDDQLRHSAHESVEHGRLKALACHYLRGQGCAPAQIRAEYRCEVGRADIVALDRRILCECGNTPPRKVLEALRGSWREFVLLPYDHEDAYRFTASPTAVQELRAQYSADLFKNHALEGLL